MSREVWLALLEKCEDTLVPVIRFETTQLRFSFVAKHLVEVRSFTRVDRLLGCGQCDRRRGSQALREFKRRRLQVLRQNNLIHDMQTSCFRGVNRLAEKEKFAGLVWCDEPRQKERAAPIGMQAHFQKRLTEAGVCRCDA